MRPGSNPELTAALDAAGIRTAVLIWFDFESGPIGVWTGTHPLTVVDADPLLSGKTFEPISHGTLYQIGANSFSYDGSESLTLSLSISDEPSDAIIYASLSADEYQGRVATVWRAIMVTPPNATSGAVWAFRRTRAGSMNELSISANGNGRTFSLTVDGHSAMITKATGSTYLDQEKIDPADTSQRYAVSIANNARMPGGGSSGGSSAGGGGGYGGGGGGGIYQNQVVR